MSTAKEHQYEVTAWPGAESSSTGAAAQGSSAAGGLRGDRPASNFRTPRFACGTSLQADGSSTVHLGDTKVVAVVHGPREPTRGGGGFSSKGVLSCDVKFSPASGAAYPLGHGRGQTPAEANASDAVLQALLPAVRVSAYPKSAIDITVTVLQDDGGAVDACIAAASLALAHAGIQCHGLVAAATVGELPAPASGLCVDLTAGEEAAATNKCSVAMMPSTGHVTSIRQVGELAPDALTPALATAAQAAGLLHSLMREALLACME